MDLEPHRWAGLDKSQIARQFSRSAKTYDQVAQLQRAMSDKLIAKLPPSTTGRLADFGCGTASSLVALAESRKMSLAGFDLSAEMIEVAAEKLKAKNFESSIDLWVADIHQSGLANESIDVVFSNAVVQWSDLRSVFSEMFRVLKPSGLLIVSTFGPSTMLELQEAWQAIGDESSRVHRFSSIEEIQSALVDVGFVEPVIESERVHLWYSKLQDLFLGIKYLGATNAASNRNRGMLGRMKFERLCQWLNQRRVDGLLSLQFEPIYVSAKRPQS